MVGNSPKQPASRGRAAGCFHAFGMHGQDLIAERKAQLQAVSDVRVQRPMRGVQCVAQSPDEVREHWNRAEVPRAPSHRVGGLSLGGMTRTAPKTPRLNCYSQGSLRSRGPSPHQRRARWDGLHAGGTQCRFDTPISAEISAQDGHDRRAAQIPSTLSSALRTFFSRAGKQIRNTGS